MPNGVDTGRFERGPGDLSDVRAALGVNDVFVFLAGGRLERAKGFDVLLQALSLVHTQMSNVIVLIAGDGSERVKLCAQASDLGLGAGIVRCLGVRDDIPDLMAAVDGFALPSRWEGLPLVLLEAASARLPVVVTNVGGNDEVTVDQVTGLLVPADAAEALGAAMMHVATLMADQRTSMGRRGRRIVEAGYSLQSVVNKWEQLYDEAAHYGSTVAGAR